MLSVLEKLQQVTDEAEVWWDSSPLDFPAWRDGFLASAPDRETRERWTRQLDRFLSPGDPRDQLVRGVTTNPSLVAKSVLSSPLEWGKQVRGLVADHPLPDVEETFALVYQDVLSRAAQRMLPLWRSSRGQYGWVSGQLDPRLMFDAARMREQALRLAALAPNLMVKVPGSAEGYRVVEELVARGISVNGTLSYTVPQFTAFARAVTGGLARAAAQGVDTSRWRAVFTHMIGRFGANTDLEYEAAARDIVLTQTDIRWAELAVLKRIHRLIAERSLPVKPLLSSLETDSPAADPATLSMHLEQSAGGAVAYTCKPQFIADTMRREHELAGFRPGAIHGEVPDPVLDKLRKLPSFWRAYEPGGMDPEEFAHYGSFVSTYAEVLGNTHKLLDFVRRTVPARRAATPVLAASGR